MLVFLTEETKVLSCFGRTPDFLYVLWEIAQILQFLNRE
jgi:hypothetical protein